MKALVGAFNQEKALVGTFSVIVQPVVEPMDRFTALLLILIIPCQYQPGCLACCQSVATQEVEYRCVIVSPNRKLLLTQDCKLGEILYLLSSTCNKEI